jgi:hypothetical protein
MGSSSGGSPTRSAGSASSSDSPICSTASGSLHGGSHHSVALPGHNASVPVFSGPKPEEVVKARDELITAFPGEQHSTLHGMINAIPFDRVLHVKDAWERNQQQPAEVLQNLICFYSGQGLQIKFPRLNLTLVHPVIKLGFASEVTDDFIRAILAYRGNTQTSAFDALLPIYKIKNEYPHADITVINDFIKEGFNEGGTFDIPAKKQKVFGMLPGLHNASSPDVGQQKGNLVALCLEKAHVGLKHEVAKIIAYNIINSEHHAEIANAVKDTEGNNEQRKNAEVVMRPYLYMQNTGIDLELAKKITGLNLGNKHEYLYIREVASVEKDQRQAKFEAIKPKYDLLQKYPRMNFVTAQAIVDYQLDSAEDIMKRPIVQHKILVLKVLQKRGYTEKLAKGLAEALAKLDLTHEHRLELAGQIVEQKEGDNDAPNKVEQTKRFNRLKGKYLLLSAHPGLEPVVADHIATLDSSADVKNTVVDNVLNKNQKNALYLGYCNNQAMRFWAVLNGKETDAVVTDMMPNLEAEDFLALPWPSRQAYIAQYHLFGEAAGKDKQMLATAFCHAWNAWREDIILAGNDKQKLEYIKAWVGTYTDAYYNAQKFGGSYCVLAASLPVYDTVRWCNQNRVNIALTFIVAAMVGVLFHEFQPFQEMMFNNPDNYTLDAKESAAVGAGMTLFLAGAGKLALDLATSKEEPGAVENALARKATVS